MKITVNYTPMGQVNQRPSAPNVLCPLVLPLTLSDYYRTPIILVTPFLLLTRRNSLVEFLGILNPVLDPVFSRNSEPLEFVGVLNWRWVSSIGVHW